MYRQSISGRGLGLIQSIVGQGHCLSIALGFKFLPIASMSTYLLHKQVQEAIHETPHSEHPTAYLGRSTITPVSTLTFFHIQPRESITGTLIIPLTQDLRAIFSTKIH